MTLQKLTYVTTITLMVCLVQTVSAQDSHWSGLGNDGLWGNPNNWNPVGVPPPASSLSGQAGNVILDAANGWSTITITNGEVETPGVGVTNRSVTTGPWNTIYGPEWGVTLNVNGSLSYDWMLGAVQNNQMAPRSVINLHGTGDMFTSGAAIGIGDTWWYHEGVFVTMNLYDNSQYSSLGGAGLWLGGHINIYDSSTFLVNGYIDMTFGSTGDAVQSDCTRIINLGGGTLKLPEGWATGADTSYNGAAGSVADLVSRGVLRVYGKAYDTNDMTVTDNGTNTIITVAPLGGSLQQVYFNPLVAATLQEGASEQTMLVGDYPSVSGVLLGSSEPGVDPATFTAPVYTSSNPNVATVDANGRLTAVAPGTTTITATVGALSSTNSVTLTVTAVPTLLHRYSFNETSGTTAADSVGGANATLVGTAAFNGTGQVVLDGATNDADYVQLPAGIITNLDDVTIEAWASFGTVTTNNNFENLFALGDSDTDPLSGTYGDGGYYILFQPRTGGATPTAAMSFSGALLPGNISPANVTTPGSLDGQTNMQIVCVFSPSTSAEALYTNGVLVGTAPIDNNLLNPQSRMGSVFTNKSVLNYTLSAGGDQFNYIGGSLYAADPGLLGSVDEFRIYNGRLTASQVSADYALGPNQLRGTNTNVSLSATPSGSHVVLSWPTSSALVTLQSSPTLGPGATWTTVPMPAGALVVSGSSYQFTMPVMSGGAQYFRLSE